MKNKLLPLVLVCTLGLAILTGCGTSSQVQANIVSAAADTTTEISSPIQPSASIDSTEDVSENSNQESTQTTSDVNNDQTEYTAQGNTINLSDYGDDSIVNINAAGEYDLSGTLSNGQVVVNVGDEDTVQLYLNNAQIINNSGSAILVQNAKEVIITLTDGTTNSVTDVSSYANLDENGEPNAVIFSHDDLTINGNGSLTVQANFEDGIQSRDDLKITGGNITITAVDDGLFGNNSVEISTAIITISSGGDTIHSDGDLIVESGTLTLNTGDDGIHANGTLTVNDGIITIQQSYEGIEATDVIINGGAIDIIASDDGINGAGGKDTSGTQNDRFSSSQGSITINGGNITIAAALSGAGDGLDANGTITITGGDILIKIPSSYRDYSSIDFDTTFSLTGGNVQTVDANGNYTQVTENNVSNGGHGKH